MTWEDRRARLIEWANTPVMQDVRTWGRRVFLGAIVAYLVYQLTTEIGWADLARSIPTHPGFYLIFLLLYYMLPATESLVYKLSWGTGWAASLTCFR